MRGELFVVAALSRRVVACRPLNRRGSTRHRRVKSAAWASRSRHPWGLDDQDIAYVDLHRVAAGHLHDGAVGTLDPVTAECARLPARESVRRHSAMPRQCADRHGPEEPQPPHCPIAAAPAAGTAASAGP